jgi:hypothetical protein
MGLEHQEEVWGSEILKRHWRNQKPLYIKTNMSKQSSQGPEGKQIPEVRRINYIH